MYSLTKYYINAIRPFIYKLITLIIYSGKRIHFSKGLFFDGIPKIIVDKGCNLTIGENVIFRRNIEIRIHKNSSIHIGNNCRIDRGVRFLATNNSKIELENKVRVGLYAVFNGGDHITIGENTLISGFVYIQTSNHVYESNVATQNAGYVHAPIIIEKNSWLAAHVVVTPGVTIGNDSVIASNAVVTKNVKEFSVVGGIPAKLIKEIKRDE